MYNGGGFVELSNHSLCNVHGVLYNFDHVNMGSLKFTLKFLVLKDQTSMCICVLKCFYYFLNFRSYKLPLI